MILRTQADSFIKCWKEGWSYSFMFTWNINPCIFVSGHTFSFFGTGDLSCSHHPLYSSRHWSTRV